VAAVFVGTAALLRAENGQSASPASELVVALCLVISGIVLLAAHTRESFWRGAIGFLTAPSEPRFRRPEEQATLRWDAFFLAALVVVAAIPRLFALSHSLWFDELWTLEFMRHGPLYAFSTQQSYNNHLLNSVLGSLCLQLYTLFTREPIPPLPPAWLVRLPAFMFGVCAPSMLYATARQHLARPAALAAAALLALSPAAVDFSAQARGYSALLFFTVAQAFFYGQALRTGAASAWVGWLACAVLGIASHLYFVCVVGVNLLFVALRAAWIATHLLDTARARAVFEQGVVLTLAWIPLALGCYALVRQEMLATAHRFAGMEPMARAHEILLPMLQLWGGVPRDGLLWVYYGACAACALLGIVHLARKPSGAAVYLPLLLVVPLLVVELAEPHYVYIRFFLFLLPAFVTLLACGLWELTLWALGPGPERAVYRALTLGVLTAGFFLLTLPGLREVMLLPKQDFAGAAERLRAEQERGRALVAVGLGNNYFKAYGLRAALPGDEAQLRAIVQKLQSVRVVDSGLLANPRMPPPILPTYVHRYGTGPIFVFPGRYRGWPYRWLDGDSDVMVYQLNAAQLPPPSPPDGTP
jgi:hypothetical protein